MASKSVKKPKAREFMGRPPGKTVRKDRANKLRTGRPKSGITYKSPGTKYNKETIKTLCKAVSEGMSQWDAAIMAGISRRTFGKWKKASVHFQRKLREAEVGYKQKLIKIVNVRSVEDGRLALEILARKWPREFGLVQKVEVIDPQLEIKKMMKVIEGKDVKKIEEGEVVEN